MTLYTHQAGELKAIKEKPFKLEKTSSRWQ